MKKESWSSFHSACGRYGKIGMEDGAGRLWSVWEGKERRKKVSPTFFLLVEGRWILGWRTVWEGGGRYGWEKKEERKSISTLFLLY